MHPIKTCGISTITSSFTTITRRISTILLWKFIFFQNLSHMISSNWNLRSSNQPLIISLHPVSIFLPSREISGPHKTFRIHNIWHLKRSKSSFYQFLQSILQNSLLQKHSISFKEITSRSSDLHTSLKINQIKFFHQINMTLWLKSKLRNFSEYLSYHIFTIILSNRNFWIKTRIWHLQKHFLKLSWNFSMLSFKFLNLNLEVFSSFIVLLACQLLLLSFCLINRKLQLFPLIIKCKYSVYINIHVSLLANKLVGSYIIANFFDINHRFYC